MTYILIDMFGGTPNISLKEDDTGEALVYDTLEEAEAALYTECQDGIIVPLGHTIPVLKWCKRLLDSLKHERNIDNIGMLDDLNELLNE